MLPENITQKNILNQMMGKNGILVIADTSIYEGEFTALYAVEDSVITTDIDGFTELSFTAGACIPFDFTSIELASGKVIVWGTGSVVVAP